MTACAGALPLAARNSNKASRYPAHLVAMSVLSFAIGFLMSYDAATAQSGMIDPLEMGGRRDVEAGASDDAQRTVPSTTVDLMGTIRMKQKRMYDTMLPADYGSFSHVFSVENLDRIFRLSTLSKKRLIRRLMIKILLGRIHHGKGGGDHDEGGEPVFLWVTAGDSAAAGHGNSYLESYTSVLEDTVTGVFRSAGIKFSSANRAGDAWSGMELAFCMESILGRDADALGWDFSPMTDLAAATVFADPLSPSQGLDPLLFGERVGRVMPHLPLLFFIGLSADGGACESLLKLETSGMGIDIMGGEALRELIMMFPNYNNRDKGRNGAQAINGFRCGGVIEGKGLCAGPFRCDNPPEGVECSNARYRAKGPCLNGRYQTPWNDGWRMHRLKGRLLGFHLAELLRLAAMELDILEQGRPRLRANPPDALLALREEEEVEEFLFSKTRPSRLGSGTSGMFESWDVLKQMDAVCINAKTASTVPPMRKKFDPSHESLCDSFIPFQNTYFRLSREDGLVSIDPLAGSSRKFVEKVPVAFGLCFKHCYGNQCGEDLSERGELPMDRDKMEIIVDGEMKSDLKWVGGCYILPGGVGSSAVIQIQNHDDRALLLSSAFLLF